MISSIRQFSPGRLAVLNRHLLSIRGIQTCGKLFQTEPTVAQKQKDEQRSGQIVPDRTPDFMTINTKVPYPKKEAKLPFVKELFLGKVDTELMAYPEVFKQDDLVRMTEEIKPIKEFFEANRYSDKLDENMLNSLKKLKMFGLNVPEHLHGKGYFETETQYAMESEGLNFKVGSLLNQHRIVVDLINEFGTEEQKIKYLPKLARGEWLATIGVFEGGSDDTGEFQTRSTLNVDQKTYKINGKKPHVINAKNAQIILIGAQTEYINYAGEWAESLNLFLVDTSSHGVTIDSTQDIPNKFNVHFDNVVVDKDCFLGDYSEELIVPQKFIERSRLSDAHLSVGIMKNLLEFNSKMSIKRKFGTTILADKNLYKELGAHICGDIYAIESAVYFTTALLDQYKKPDVSLECATIKSFATSRALEAVLHNLSYSGHGMLESNSETKRLLNDAINLQVQGEALHSIKQYIGLSGLQYAGKHLHESIKKIRNPMYNPMSVIGKIFRGQTMDDPKLLLKLNEYVHPSLETAAELLEKSIVRQQLATETLLHVMGTEIIHYDSHVIRLSDICELNFMMMCTLIRASRSYCIGLKFNKYDLLMANLFCAKASDKVQQLSYILGNVDLPSEDVGWAKYGKKYFENGQYYADHPLARTF